MTLLYYSAAYNNLATLYFWYISDKFLPTYSKQTVCASNKILKLKDATVMMTLGFQWEDDTQQWRQKWESGQLKSTAARVFVKLFVSATPPPPPPPPPTHTPPPPPQPTPPTHTHTHPHTHTPHTHPHPHPPHPQRTHTYTHTHRASIAENFACDDVVMKWVVLCESKIWLVSYICSRRTAYYEISWKWNVL